jgi:hypothetical protein
MAKNNNLNLVTNELVVGENKSTKKMQSLEDMLKEITGETEPQLHARYAYDEWQFKTGDNLTYGEFMQMISRFPYDSIYALYEKAKKSVEREAVFEVLINMSVNLAFAIKQFSSHLDFSDFVGLDFLKTIESASNKFVEAHEAKGEQV